MGWRKLKHYLFGVTTQDIDQASIEAAQSADWTFVLWLCDLHLQKHAQAIPVVLTRARCYQAMNQPLAFKREVALAYALDDTFVPAIYHQIGVLVEERRVEEALDLLATIKDHPAVRDSVDSMLAGLCMRRAFTEPAREYQLRAWMANFDNLRYANSYLFSLAYADVTELEVAKEHQFWAKTLLPPAEIDPSVKKTVLARTSKKLGQARRATPDEMVGQKRRVRIGYWGGDFKEHSVRYFFRPLIEAQNREVFEVFIYDENFMVGQEDEQTRAVKRHADHFFDVCRLQDDELSVLIESHGLDILVELQGHTSANRLHLWQRRLAPLQITGLAYPPTTGLANIDYKLVDLHMVNPQSAAYYTERPLVLPHSFWCFDPKEDASYEHRPPYHHNGYLTLGCWGNAAKITSSVMHAWGRILQAAPSARLLILSHTFGDAVTENAFRELMQQAGVPETQLDCQASVPRDELWQQYQKVDLMLDTFPFNGGTTTCWATYAGVPVLTMAGSALTSCMGKSVMSNLGFPEFVVNDTEGYVTKALELIANPDPIDQFRQVARERFKNSSLGNGEQFTHELETALLDLLEKSRLGQFVGPSPCVPPLDLTEMLRRARMVGYHGNADACDRILELCREYYGQDLKILEYEAEALLGRHEFAMLEERCAHLVRQSFTLTHILAQAAVATQQGGKARDLIKQLPASPLALATDAQGSAGQSNEYLQQCLWRAWLSTQEKPTTAHDRGGSTVQGLGPNPCTINILVVGRDNKTCKSRAREIEERLHSDGIRLVVETCWYHERVEKINELIDDAAEPNDIVIVIRDNVEIVNSRFLLEVAHHLGFADIISTGGARRWTQKDWTQDLPAYKFWGLMRPSRLADGLLELHFAGNNAQTTIADAKVLDGQLLAFVPTRVGEHRLNEALGEAGYWSEEDWTNRLATQGKRLLIHRHLGVVVHPSYETGSLHTTPGQKDLLKRLHIHHLGIPIEDYSIQTVQVNNAHMGMEVAGEFLTESPNDPI